MKRLDHYWYSLNPVALSLAPISWLFCLLVQLRRVLYRFGWLRSFRVTVPVIVVGNITVGGSGKTPLVIWLANFLRSHGFRPGIVSRGYGGRATEWPQEVSAASDPAMVGDEPVLIASLSGCPLTAGPDRVAAAQTLLERHGCDVIISDDGMQHYRLRRDVEIAVVDVERRSGNGFCLPAGPLREPVTRLHSVDMVVGNGGAAAGEYGMTLEPTLVRRLVDGTVRPLRDWAGLRVHAVAGIGNPPRFFAMLRAHGVVVEEHPFADHHAYDAGDIRFDDDAPVLLTEKDAVKCTAHADQRHWAVAVQAQLPDAFGARLLELLKR